MAGRGLACEVLRAVRSAPFPGAAALRPAGAARRLCSDGRRTLGAGTGGLRPRLKGCGSSVLTVRRFATEDKSAGAGDDAGKKQQESDRRFDESGEYDTQEQYKRIGNPIQWANPTGGGSQMEDNSSKHWRWVYPAGATMILLMCLWSRRKNLRKEQEEQVISKPEIRTVDTTRFATPAYRPPAQDDGDDGEEVPPPSAAVGGGFGFESAGGFSPPPSSSQQPSW